MLFKNLKNGYCHIGTLPKSLLSEAVRKIRDLLPSTAGPLTSNGLLNFPLRIDLSLNLTRSPLKSFVTMKIVLCINY